MSSPLGNETLWWNRESPFQTVTKEKVLNCDNTRCRAGAPRVRPLSVKWQPESFPDSPSGLSFQCVVDIRHIVFTAGDPRYSGSLSAEVISLSTHTPSHPIPFYSLSLLPSFPRLPLIPATQLLLPSSFIDHPFFYSLLLPKLGTVDAEINVPSE